MTANEKDIEAISHRLPYLCDYRHRFADNGSPRFREAILDRKCVNSSKRGHMLRTNGALSPF